MSSTATQLRLILTKMGLRQMDQSKPLLVDGERRCSQDSLDEYQLSQPAAKQLVFKVASCIHPAHVTTILRRLGYSLIPQPIRSYVWEDYAPPTKQFPTSYLNGLRGLTAIKVFTFHYMMAFTDFTFLPWATDDRHNHIIAFPIIRYFYSGFTSHIFFAIAGYLASLRLFQLIDRNDASSQAKVLSSISGSLFRRGFRLYLPVLIITFITTTYIHLGFYEKNRDILANHVDLFPGEWNEEKPIMFSTLWEQYHFWLDEMFRLCKITTEGTFYPIIDQHLWSIQAEMRASVHLYGSLVAIMTCKRHVRLILLLVIAYVYFLWNHWEVWVYVLGAAVAQLDIILTEWQENQQPLLSEKQELHAPNVSYPRLSKEMRKAIRYTGFLIAFYLLSYPIFGDKYYAPGYETLKRFIPEWMERPDKFYANIGTIILLLLLVRSNPNTSKWRRFLMSTIPQYLGTISFGLYLTQALMLHMYGYMIPQWIWWSFGTQGKDASTIGWLLPILVGYSISLLTSLWVADVWTREVEGRCIRFVKMLEKTCFKEK